jgi:hypothetical protein
MRAYLRYSVDDKIKWAWLRAVEWIEWPLFLSQPLVPILIYFYTWPIVILSVLVVNFLWRAFIVPFWVSPFIARIGLFFVSLKFISAPLMAYILWQKGNTYEALIAVSWPFFGSWLASYLLIVPETLLRLTSIGEASQIGLVQKRFAEKIGIIDINET